MRRVDPTCGLKSVGLNFAEEQRRVAEEIDCFARLGPRGHAGPPGCVGSTGATGPQHPLLANLQLMMGKEVALAKKAEVAESDTCYASGAELARKFGRHR